MRIKNKLLIAITTTKVYQYNTDAETEDVAFDEFTNNSLANLKLVESIPVSTEIHGFVINKNKKGDTIESQDV